jgi:hypothetical protein
MKKIQISPVKKVEDAIVIWPEATPDVDIVQDLIDIKIKPNSVKAIYSFDSLGFSDPKDVLKVLNNYFDMLEPNGELYIIENDHDYIARAFLGGDLPIEEMNLSFNRSTYLNSNEVSRLLEKVGIPEKNQRVWNQGMKFKKEHYQLIISGKKPVIK